METSVNNKCKAFTSLEQSRNLAEILPFESADMRIGNYVGKYACIDGTNVHYYHKSESFEAPEIVPCWSLAALLNVMPKDESIDCSISFGYYNGKGKYIEKWLCAFEKEGETTDDFIIETFDGDNPVDACYQMVIRLKEMNLL